MQLELEGKEIIINVLYSKRKNFLLAISPEGHIELKAPSKATEEEILRFLHSNTKLLLENQHRIENRKFITSHKKHTLEENFLYLGKVYTLEELLEDIPTDMEAIPLALQNFYTRRTKEVIKSRLRYFEKLIGVQSKEVKVVDSPGSWGTCNNRKQLTFNYRLSMAPPAVIDYVIIHELCHLQHLNHDRSFWRKVGAYDTHYKEHQAYLERFGAFMTI